MIHPMPVLNVGCSVDQTGLLQVALRALEFMARLHVAASIYASRATTAGVATQACGKALTASIGRGPRLWTRDPRATRLSYRCYARVTWLCCTSVGPRVAQVRRAASASRVWRCPVYYHRCNTSSRASAFPNVVRSRSRLMAWLFVRFQFMVLFDIAALRSSYSSTGTNTAAQLFSDEAISLHFQFV